LGIELLLEAVDFVVQTLQLALLGFKLLAQCFQVALPFIGGGDCLFNRKGADLGARKLRNRLSCGGSAGRSGRRRSALCRSAGRRSGLAQNEDRKTKYQGESDVSKLNHWIL